MTEDLGALFDSILADTSLQELVEQAKKRQTRQEEKRSYEQYMELGQAVFEAIKGQDSTLLGNDERETLKKIGDAIKVPLQFRVWSTQSSQDYVESVVTRFLNPGRNPYEQWDKSFRYMLYGFGSAALSQNDVGSAIIALSGGGWLEDDVEGAELKRKIAEKVPLLDARSKIAAAMSWQKIQGFKAQPSTQQSSSGSL